jgi:MEMO1 family protein
MTVRMAVVAGQFYESSPEDCRNHIEQMLPSEPIEADLPEPIVAGVVPHAGWVFSGDLAALVFAAIKQNAEDKPVDTFVIFGAVHSAVSPMAHLYDSGQWGTPLGAVDVDEDLAEAILTEGGQFIQANCSSHSREHSIEVQVPIIQHVFPEAKILPLMVPATPQAHEIGAAVGRAIQNQNKRVACIGSTDLTHYGPSYLMTSMGTGAEAIRWAKDTNDKFFLDQALSMQADRLVDTANTYHSACGGGATAATVAAARELGAEKGCLLAHTTSAEVMAKKFNRSSTDSVGYAAIVY